MRNLTLILTATLCLAAALLACLPLCGHNVAHAWGWTNDPWNGMVSVCDAPGAQQNPKICALDGGNTLIAWADERPGISAIYYQVLNSFGQPLLEDDGRPIFDGNWYYGFYTTWYNQGLLSDGQGGCIAVVSDARSGYGAAYGQRIDSLGNRLWGSSGLPLAIWPNHDLNERTIAGDSSGNFFLGFTITGNGFDAYAQKFDINGNRLWGDYGAPLSVTTWDQRDPVVVPDMQGGVIAAWRDNRYNGVYHYFTQHLDSLGNPLWTLNGRELLTQFGAQLLAGIQLNGLPDGEGGAIWNHDAGNLMFVLRQGPDGRTLRMWYNYYVDPLNAVTGIMIRHPIDGSYWMSTMENRAAGGWGQFLYRFNNDLVFNWPRGLTMSQTGQLEEGIRITWAPQGVYCFRQTYVYFLNSKYYVTLVDSAGGFLWTVNVVMGGSCPGGGPVFSNLAPVPDENGSSVCAFEDRRFQPSDISNISAQRVNADGTLGTPNKYIPIPQRDISIIQDPYPGNSGASIRYTLSRSQPVNLSVYNILGARIATLMSGLQQPGAHVCSWDATLKPSGVYLLRLQAGEDIVVMKVMMVK